MPNETPTSFPAGSVVFVPDGDRVPRQGEWFANGNVGFVSAAVDFETPRAIYYRIDLPAAVQVVSGEMESAVKRLNRFHENHSDLIETIIEIKEAFSHILTPAPVVKTPEKTVREQIAERHRREPLRVQSEHDQYVNDSLRILADAIDRIEARMKEGAKP